MTNIVLNDVTNISGNPISAELTINENFRKIEEFLNTAQLSPTTPSPDPDTSVYIQAEIRRFDGVSSSGRFNGGILLQSGQLTAAQLNNVSVLINNQEVPCAVAALQGTHSDNSSLRAIQVQFDYALGSSATLPVQIRVGAPRTAAALTIQPVNKAWIDAPRLLACTDANHMCRSWRATLPLIPLANSAVPERWRTWLSNELDNFRLNTIYSGASYYNAPSILACSYMTRGTVLDLHRAMTLYSGTYNGVQEYVNLRYFTPADTTYIPDCNPEDLPSDDPTSAVGNEALSGRAHDSIYIYYLTGWEHARLNIMFSAGWAATNNPLVPSSTFSSFASPRFLTKWQAQPMIYAISMRMGETIAKPSNGWTFNGYTDYSPRLLAFNNKLNDRSNDWSVGDYRRGVWSHHTAYLDGTDTNPPFFQIPLTSKYLLLHHYQVGNDNRVLAANDTIAQAALARLTTATAANGHTVYRAPYLWLQPGTGTDEFPILAGMHLLPLSAYWARSGNSAALTAIDRMADERHFLVDLTSTELRSWKTFGEHFLGAYHACAWRSGVAVGSWWT